MGNVSLALYLEAREQDGDKENTAEWSDTAAERSF